MNSDEEAQELQLFEQVTNGGYTEFKQLIGLLRGLNVNWCLIGDAAVNAYVEPIYMADVHFAVTEMSEELRNFSAKAFVFNFRLTRFINVSPLVPKYGRYLVKGFRSLA
jgi:hypothetical protein